MNTLAQRTQKKAVLPHINRAFRALRCTIAASVPSDFEWWLTFGPSEISAGWTWTGDPQRTLQGEVRADSLGRLLDRWRAVDWRAERSEAKANLRLR